MVLLENRVDKEYVLLNDFMQQICTFSNANLVRCLDKRVYQLQTDVTLYVLCELPIASTTIIRNDSMLSSNVVFYSEQEEEPDEPIDPDAPVDPDDVVPIDLGDVTEYSDVVDDELVTET